MAVLDLVRLPSRLHSHPDPQMTEEEIRAHAVRVVRDWVKDGVDPEYVATDWDIVSQEVNRDDLDEIVEEADRIMEKLANGKMPR